MSEIDLFFEFGVSGGIVYATVTQPENPYVASASWAAPALTGERNRSGLPTVK